MALLCVAEADCIVPIGQTKDCFGKVAPNLTCHRHDQSLFNTLRYNMEYRQQIQDASFLPHLNHYHPRWSTEVQQFFGVERYQLFKGTDDEWLKRLAFRLKMNDSCTIHGKKFDCSFAWLLERYKLSDKFAITENIEVDELNSICNFERHVFDFSQMVDGSVRRLETYAWKVFLLAHVLLEYDTVVWVDTTIIFDNFNLTAILTSMNEGRIGPVQMPLDAWHGTNIATHPGMYEYLPLFSNFEAKKGNELTNDPPQFESGLLIIHKSEQTRQLMKCQLANFKENKYLKCSSLNVLPLPFFMALLCAAEADCMVPIGQTIHCLYVPNMPISPPNATCHRQEQSLMTILVYDLEFRRQIENSLFLPHQNPQHPRWTNRYSKTNRLQTFAGPSDEWVKKLSSDQSDGFKEVPFRPLAHCHANNGSNETTLNHYGIEFRLTREGGNCDDGLLICYPALLQNGNHWNMNSNFKNRKKFIINAQLSNSIEKECAQKMPKDAGKNGTTLWRGLKVRTMPTQKDDGRSFIFETSFASEKYNFLDAEQRQFSVFFYLNQTAGPFTRISLVENDIDARAMQNDFLRANGPSFLSDFAGLWLLGLDMLPMAHQKEQKQQLKMTLFTSRSRNCSMDAWFIQSTDSVRPPKMPHVDRFDLFPPKYVDLTFSAKFTNTKEQLISIKALTDVNIKNVTVGLLNAKMDGVTKTEVSFKIGTDSDFEVALPGLSQLITNKGVRLARGSYVLNLDIVVVKRCFMVRLNGAQFGGLSCPTGDPLPWEAINRIKVQGQMLLLGKPIVKQMEQTDDQIGCEKNSKCASGIAAESDECDGEKMAYTFKMNDSRIIRGKKFNCSFKRHLERYKLSDKFPIEQKIEMNETNSVCNLEWRSFDFSQLVEGRIRELRSFAWKFFVWAEVLLEYDTVVWLDTSVVFQKNNFKMFFEPMEKGKIGTVQIPSFALHSMLMSTHPGMFEFLPMYTNFEPNRTYELIGTYAPVSKIDPPQFETNFVIMHKSEQTRQAMKW
ncbi:hypothetical protein niasHT_013009 [Heterodera trifolii]|uniref:Nucleotide-diphospho-sugar transferase domain-containing protein n=1 Tax=Heterodera trifolii TaxID=157864 RepID=A0ABD2L3J8_9BILA